MNGKFTRPRSQMDPPDVLLEKDILYVRAGFGTMAHQLILDSPDRRYEHNLKCWTLPWHKQNYDYLERVKFAGVYGAYKRPTKSAYSVTRETGKRKWLIFASPYNERFVDMCRNVPGTRRYHEQSQTWRIAPSRVNIRYIIDYFRNIGLPGDFEWSEDAKQAVYDLKNYEKWVAGEKERRKALEGKKIEDFPFTTEPYEHQMKALMMSWDRESFALLMDMGTGKTKVIIDNAEMLHRDKKIDAVVVICPNSIKAVWAKEIATHGQRVERDVLVYESSKGKKQRKEIDELLAFNDRRKLLWVIVNVESMSFPSGMNTVIPILKGRRTMLVVDESSRIKTSEASRTRNVLKLRGDAAYRRIMTGTPITKLPEDVYPQMYFLDPDILGFDSKTAFRNHFSEMSTISIPTRNKGAQKKFDTINVVDGFRNLSELNELMWPWSYRVRKDECLDLPDKVYQTRHITMTKRQTEAYEAMRDYMLVAFDDTDGEVEAFIVLTQMLRLQQIVGGWVKFEDAMANTDDLRPEPIDKTNPRLDEVVRIAQEDSGKMIIWAVFRPEVEGIAARLRKEFGDDTVVEFHGDVDVMTRADNVEAFQDPDSPVRFFVGNQATGGMGITLTQASTVIYYSNSFALEQRLQSEDRAHRAGLKHPVTYIDLIAEGTIDEHIVDALRDKKKIADIVTGDASKEGWREWL